MCLWSPEGNYMMMRVVYPDGKYDLVNGDLLSSLIESKGIIRFKRLDGWVTVASQECRNSANKNRYTEPERRKHRDSQDSLIWPVEDAL